MQCYSELTPPTAVTLAVSLPLLNAEASNLVVVKTSLLQIFELKPQRPGSHITTNATHQPARGAGRATSNGDASGQSLKLCLIGEYDLSGTVTSVRRIKALNTKSGGEALLLSFRDAKISLVEWDPEAHGIATISIHYYEGDELLGAPWDADLAGCQSYLTVDPSSRCAALKFGTRNLAILPFRQVGDDLVEDDYNPDLEEAMKDVLAQEKDDDGDGDSSKTPYGSSFVLPVTALDPNLTHTIHLAFLHEYREPTFGILSSSKAPSTALLYERKDVITYTVFMLDLEQRASTTLLSVPNLPYDLFEVVPMPAPVGGALLVGGNEFVHVDQAGKTNALAVNEFARKGSSFPMTDQSDLALRLEGCVVAPLALEQGEALIICRTGNLAILSFRLDGRSVSGLSIRLVAHDLGGMILSAGASCASDMGHGRLFVGSEDADAVLLGWSRRLGQFTRKRSHVEMVAEDDNVSLDEEDIEDYEDDLYATGSSTTMQQPIAAHNAAVPSSYSFGILDGLPNVGPVRDVAVSASSGHLSAGHQAANQMSYPQVHLVSASGRGKAGCLATMNATLDPKVLQTFETVPAQAVWSVQAKKPVPKNYQITNPQQNSDAHRGSSAAYDEFLIVSRLSKAGGEESVVYTITSSSIEETSKAEFESDAGATLNVGSMASKTRIVQVLRGEIRSYDSDFGLAQIFPLNDEDSEVEVKAVAASFADPYLLVIRDDKNFIVLESDKSGDLDEVERGEGALNGEWLAGCLYTSPHTHGKILAFLINAQGGLEVFDLPRLHAPIFVAEGLSFLPPIVSNDYIPRRTASKTVIVEVIVADVGDETSQSPYMILRTISGDLTLYQPYQFPMADSSPLFGNNLRWLKVTQPIMPQQSDDQMDGSQRWPQAPMLKAFHDIGGYSGVLQAGRSPRVVLKEASSSPRVIRFRALSVRDFTSFHTGQCDKGFAYLDAGGTLRICQLSPQTRYGDTSWAVSKCNLGCEVHALAYYHPKDVFVLGTSERSEFKLPEDDYHWEWNKESIALRPDTEHGAVQLFDLPTGAIICSHRLGTDEQVLCIKVLDLEISEITRERRLLAVVGTAIVQGEDLSPKGCIYIFDIVTVVPEPDRPETNRKLKLVVREEVKGAVTAVSSIGTQGFLLMAQGQKCMVRGLKEDGSLLPVAFMDTQCYVTVAKELKGSRMLVLGDIAKGIWFAGYTEEPYKMMLFGKERSRLEVVCAEFLPHRKQLFMLVADADCRLHVLQFDPDHPKSLSGQRLLHKSTFNAGHLPTTMTLLPSTLPATDRATQIDNGYMDMDGADSPAPPAQVLISTQSGSLALVTSIDEQTYRRLSAVQAHLLNMLEHPCGLNPRAYRAAEGEGFGSRGVIDGSVLMRWAELSTQRRAEVCSKTGIDEWTIRSDLELVSGAGLGYL